MSSMTRLTTRRFAKHRMALASGVLIILLALAAGAAPLVEALLGVDGNEVDLLARFGAAGPGHPLGTDELGRDVLVRLLFGGQVSLTVALITAFAAAVIGAVIGLTRERVRQIQNIALGRLKRMINRIEDFEDHH